VNEISEIKRIEFGIRCRITELLMMNNGQYNKSWLKKDPILVDLINEFTTTIRKEIQKFVPDFSENGAGLEILNFN